MLKVQGLQVCFSDRPVLNGVDLTLNSGEIIALLGASGCGKTTVLRSVAGFQTVDKGEIFLRDACVSCPGNCLPPEQRGLGMVFQDYALFPHLSVEDNVAFGLFSMNRKEKKQRVDELLKMVDLNEYANRYPHELSGGQQQRVALARSLAPKPDLILMDEPFSNLDPNLRQRLAGDVRDILKRTNTAAIIVTHDTNEAEIISDRIAHMSNGQIIHWQQHIPAVA